MIRFQTTRKHCNQFDCEPITFYVGSSREIRNIVKHLEKQGITNGFCSPVKYSRHNRYYSIEIERNCWGYDRYYVARAEHLFDYMSLGTIEITSHC